MMSIWNIENNARQMVKFLDLKAVNDSFGATLPDAVQRIVSSGWYLQGAENRSFEEEYSKFIGTRPYLWSRMPIHYRSTLTS